ncbi:MAG TPA: hypothetical protein VLJ37_11205 [bacterium]|nr:hypothetical protein [bacterium]
MGGSESTTSYPPPVDYSQAMMYQSDNNKTIAMGQIMAQQFAMQQASMDRQMQIASNLELGLEKLDSKLQIAKLNYLQFMTEEENRHVEKMTEIGAEVDAARGANVTETADFLANDGGSYTPGAIWDDTSSFVNGSRVDYGKKMDDLLQNDKNQNDNWHDTFQAEADAKKAEADAAAAQARNEWEQNHPGQVYPGA